MSSSSSQRKLIVFLLFLKIHEVSGGNKYLMASISCQIKGEDTVTKLSSPLTLSAPAPLATLLFLELVDTLLPQGLCTCGSLCLEALPHDSHKALRVSCQPLLRCHLLRCAFPVPTSSYPIHTYSQFLSFLVLFFLCRIYQPLIYA